MPEIFLYGIGGAIMLAGLAVMMHGYITAPDGYEDKYGFHYGRPHASRRMAAVRSRHNANHRTRAHRSHRTRAHRRKVA
jgi:hypothetical protein